MCIEDIRMGRGSTALARMVPVGNAAAVVLCGEDPMRTRLILSGDGTGTIFVAPRGITPAALSGFTLVPAEPIQTFRVEEWGKLITAPWSAIAAAGTVNVAVAEIGLEKQ